MDSDDEGDATVGAVEIYVKHQAGSRSRDQMWVDVKISGITLSMELDTGSGVSIITKADYDAKFSHLPLQPTSIVFKTYTGEKLKPIGVLTVTVEYNKNRYEMLNLYVVNRGGPPLLGREWLNHIRLDWHNINRVSSGNMFSNLFSS